MWLNRFLLFRSFTLLWWLVGRECLRNDAPCLCVRGVAFSYFRLGKSLFCFELFGLAFFIILYCLFVVSNFLYWLLVLSYIVFSVMCIFLISIYCENVVASWYLHTQERHVYHYCEIVYDWRTDTANQRGGEWMGADKILLEGDENSKKMNTASNTRLWLTTQVGQAHVATGVPLDLGTKTQPSDPRTQQNTKPRVYRPTPVRPVSTTGQTGPCWW
jgi:hypothetical protein